ncbi:MAG: hypothetical protein GY749_20235 [Desulfobacteraceae bacterium]|nr:hypothetical protein [Desulfobacteraceae bacterium]
MFTDTGKVIPNYLQEYFSDSLPYEVYDELISDKTVELYKARFLNEMASIHKGISTICIYFGDTFLRRKSRIVLKLFDNVLKVLKNKSYSLFERLAKSEKLDIKKYSEFKKEQSEYHWEIWATYLDALIFAIENNMYFGVYYYC